MFMFSIKLLRGTLLSLRGRWKVSMGPTWMVWDWTLSALYLDQTYVSFPISITSIFQHAYGWFDDWHKPIPCSQLYGPNMRFDPLVTPRFLGGCFSGCLLSSAGKKRQHHLVIYFFWAKLYIVSPNLCWFTGGYINSKFIFLRKIGLRMVEACWNRGSI